MFFENSDDTSIGKFFLFIGGLCRIYVIYMIGKFASSKKLFAFFIASGIGSNLLGGAILVTQESALSISIVAGICGVTCFLFYKEMVEILLQKLFYIPFFAIALGIVSEEYMGYLLILAFASEFVVMIFTRAGAQKQENFKENDTNYSAKYINVADTQKEENFKILDKTQKFKQKISNLQLNENFVINIFRILYFVAFVCFCYFLIRWSLTEYRGSARYYLGRVKTSAIVFGIVYVLQIVVLGQKI
ncbi:hypothetical protein OFO01_06600 [Campylobacter sp. JMF_01 NE2]|uniref:hypothetical protein n=1 Tax=unclassified Campylobacter TaxID=2593542 RepID=UPI0022EA0EDF|nr:MULTISPECIES: hypothetical protein [unclassified Campylobacter]MDA3053119.1 hypothetical protein [Campylobacter sp. JMF_03 NE3]MDA3067450.1 hypothetical protein [Campylobacter sp. JMF_01 NE2]